MSRVSTRQQDLEVQLQLSQAKSCEVTYKENFTGTNMEREELKNVLSLWKDGDTLVVTKLDRLAQKLKSRLKITHISYISAI